MAKKEFKRLRVLLIDGNNYFHRGHWAVKGQGGKKSSLMNSDGFMTTAIRGMLNIIIADINVLHPDILIVCYDSSGAPNWRKVLYPEYKCGPARLAQKAKAKESGENVYEQLKPIQRILRAMGVTQIGVLGEEADDIMATLAVEYAALGHEVLISTNDKDLGSTVTKDIKIVESTTRRLLGVRGINEKYGVKPKHMVEWLMLMGDSIDNIPGVFKCGAKTAAKLLNEHGNLKTILANVDSFTPALKLNMKKGKKNFKWTRPLLTLRTTVQHGLDLEQCGYRAPKLQVLDRICTELELKTTHKQLLEVLKKRNQWKT